MLIGLGGVRISSMMNVDNVVFRGRVRACADADVVIATALNNGDALDGLTLDTDDLVLLTGQTDKSQNGVYVVGVTPARWTEFNTSSEMTVASIFLVGEGTVYAESTWMFVTGGPITVDTTDLFFYRVDESRAESGVPIEVVDGARVRPWPDTFGRLVPKGFDLAQDAQQIVNIAPSLLLSPITPWAALPDTSLPVSTPWVSAENFHHNTFIYVVSAIGTSVNVLAEGSPDGSTNPYNLNDDEVETQKIANGAYVMQKSNFKAGWVRFTFSSRVGGSPVVTPFLIQGN